MGDAIGFVMRLAGMMETIPLLTDATLEANQLR
jgi:hypothetical protein